jgi:hypothetical protein
MKRFTVFAASIGFILASMPHLHAESVHFLLGSSLYNNLSALLNQNVKIILRGGGEIGGAVTGVGNNLVRLEGPAGYESLVVIDEIAVLSVQVKK